MSGLSKELADLVPPKFGVKFISSTFERDANNNLRDVGLMRIVIKVKKLPVAGWATPGWRKKSYAEI